MHKLLIGVSVFALALLVAVTYLTARFVDRGEILRVKTELQELHAQRSAIDSAVARRDSIITDLESDVTGLLEERTELRARIDSLDRALSAELLSVRLLRTSDDLEGKFTETFPAVAGAFRVTEVYSQAEDVSLQYISIPLWFSETFIINSIQAGSYREQLGLYGRADSLSMVVFSLKDQVTSLEREKTIAYQEGYDTALARYDDLNARYIGLLEKPPKFTLGAPKWVWIAGSLVGGAAVGYAVGN